MEQWETVVDFPDYLVSDLGNVVNFRTKRIIRPSSNHQGVTRVNLSKDGVYYTRSLSRLVCRAFHGEPEEGQVVVFRDDDERNCQADNLYWGERGFAWERTRQNKRTTPMRNRRIERIKTGEVFENSLECAQAVDGLETLIVVCAGDPLNRFYRGSNYRWLSD